LTSALAGASAPGDAPRESPRAAAAVVISMPFMDIDRPSIQLGLLKSLGEARGFPVQTLHANLDFAVRIGPDYYRSLSEHRGRMLGDWLFSVAAFGDTAPDPDGRFLDEFGGGLSYLGDSHDRVRKRLLTLREREVPAYLDELVDAYPWQDVGVVGFSSTFQQNAASFALARRLKRRFPHLVTVFGGANFDGEMGLELVAAVDCIDYAVIGEADAAFPGILSALAAGTDPGAVPGVARRLDGRVTLAPAEPPFARLDELPVPDYAEYFRRAEDLGLLTRAGRRNVWIPFESSRGCWWGAKHHCTFCGLNGNAMGFRSKSPQRVLDELAALARRCGTFRFQAVDNILDVRYLTTLLPDLVASAADYEIFYEVKANLTRAQLRLLAQSGITRIQPGLESLSSRVLRLMRKGTRAAQNVNLLRWARYYGIDVAWNVLWGFPGETAQDYREQADVVPHLWHLQPPSNALPIWMERFSPLYADSAAFGVRYRRPEASYRYVYPAGVELDRVAYFFEYELVENLPHDAHRELAERIAKWRAAGRSEPAPALTYWSAPGLLQIYDSRTDDHTGTYTFYDTVAEIYLACSDRPTTAAAVREKLGPDVPVDLIEEAFREFQRRGLMFLDGSLALALAIPAVGGR
jgi:ribosomal peptide maturation radical SAM protein 1